MQPANVSQLSLQPVQLQSHLQLQPALPAAGLQINSVLQASYSIIYSTSYCYQLSLQPASRLTVFSRPPTAASQPSVGLMYIVQSWGIRSLCSFSIL